jgi:V8-like Glu-specific endopeptidase
VARVEIPEGTPKGTGFLVGRDLLLTNQHVLKEKGCLEEAVARFGYMNDASGVASVGKVVPIQPDFYFASPAQDLDYALVRLQEKPIENLATVDELRQKSMAELARIGKHRGYLVLAPRLLSEYRRVNIIQHPAGNPLKVVMTQNYVVHRTDTRVQYVAETMNLSSGSPVFNERWEVVALHHSGSPYPAEPFSDTIKKTLKGSFRVNEGIPMRAILEDFKFKGIDRYLPCE